MLGKIKWFNNKKGFGFAHGEDNNDYFIHYRELRKNGIHKVFDNDKIEYDIEQGEKGLYATNIKVIKEIKEKNDANV